MVADVDKARSELIDRGAAVGTVDDIGGGVKYTQITDPAGNTLVLQEMAWRAGEKFQNPLPTSNDAGAGPNHAPRASGVLQPAPG